MTGLTAAAVFQRLFGDEVVLPPGFTQVTPFSAVHWMRLPVIRKDHRLELLPVGYDQESGVLTLDWLPYNHAMPIYRAADVLQDALGRWPWPEGELLDVMSSRVAATHLLVWLGAYCRCMAPQTAEADLILPPALQTGTNTSTAEILSALWTACREWNDRGRPGFVSPLDFEGWARCLGWMVQGLGFLNPLAAVRDYDHPENEPWRRVLVAIADRIEEGMLEFPQAKLVETARELGVLRDLVGSRRAAATASKKIGKQMRVWSQVDMTDSFGRLFTLTRRRTRERRLYQIRILT